MIHPNVAHPTPDCLAAIPTLASNVVLRAVEVRSQVCPSQRPLAPPVAAMVDTVGWSAGRPRC